MHTSKWSSKQYVTINTHRSLYAYQRLPFGIATAPSIFQAMMDQALVGINGVQCRIDDIAIRTSPEVHVKTVDEVLTKLAKHGIKAKLVKCEFSKPGIEYVGYDVDKDGCHPMQDKVKPIRDAPRPTKMQELCSFLGLLNFNGNFIPDLSTLLHPMHELLHLKNKWTWTQECEDAFEKSKTALLENNVLVPYDVNKELNLATDASPYGVGAVLSHKIDGVEQQVAFASRTLTKSEKNYSQIEKDALGIVYGVRKFHKYLYGWRSYYRRIATASQRITQMQMQCRDCPVTNRRPRKTLKPRCSSSPYWMNCQLARETLVRELVVNWSWLKCATTFKMGGLVTCPRTRRI
jgi:hypothetical protein